MPAIHEFLSSGVEVLCKRLLRKRHGVDFDVLIIGSGYGGAVAAARLSGLQNRDGAPLRVGLLERGREILPGQFPAGFAELWREVRLQRHNKGRVQGNADGMYDIHISPDLTVLSGNGLGGGSLINAGVAERMADAVWQDNSWPHSLREEALAGDFAQWYARAEQMLAVCAAPATQKTLQLQRLGQYMPPHAGASRFQTVQVALNLQEGVNPHGIVQHACNGCGDCFTGCNFNAKNTLCTNYLALAKRQGVEMFCGAKVSHVQRSSNDKHWEVCFALSDTPNQQARQLEFKLQAHCVVLAAGSLGSTEILLRSHHKGMSMSPRLGHNFNGNGDMIWAGYAQDQTVRPGAEQSVAHSARKVGPTISAMLDGRAHPHHQLVIQDCAVPAPLYRLFAELLTTNAVLYRMSRSAPSELHMKHDPDSVDPQAIAHSALYLGMGRDCLRWSMSLHYSKLEETRRNQKGFAPNQGHLKFVSSPKVLAETSPNSYKDAPDFASRSETWLAPAVQQLGGTLLANPAWRAWPTELAHVLEGNKPGGHHITVHPLGGCCMGEHGEQGVVDEYGAVFRDGGYETWPDLYVWDGAILPTPVGINPLLTISALAERAAAHCIQQHGWQTRCARQLPAPDCAQPAALDAARSANSAAERFAHAARSLPLWPLDYQAPSIKPTELRFSEVMDGELQIASRAHPCKARLCVDFVFDVDLPAFVRDPQRSLTIANARLELEGIGVIALHGEVHWLHLCPARNPRKVTRALLQYVRLRLWPDYQSSRQRKAKAGEQHVPLWRRIRALLRLASHIGSLRQLRYILQPKAGQEICAALGPDLHWRLVGVKNVEYRAGNNLWRSLSEMALILHRQGQPRPHLARGLVKLDWVRLLREKSFQISACEQNPYAMLDLISLGGFFLRALLRIHFWNLRKPDYAPEAHQLRKTPELPGLLRSEHHCKALRHARQPHNGTLSLPLTRYQARRPPPQSDTALPPVLLLHGFGSCGKQFCIDHANGNLTQSLCQAGRDVWILELRSSIALPGHKQQWKLDDIARLDIPAAVDYILQHCGCEALDVVAHCIGSAMFNLAVLSGQLQGAQGKSKIRAAVMLQVGPVFKVSHGNRIRGEFAAQMRDWMMDIDELDSSMNESEADWRQVLLDRLLATYPLPPQEERKLRPTLRLRRDIAVYLRSAAVFGRLFELDNLAPATRLRLAEVLGATNMTTYRQILHAVLDGKLLDQYGRNLYVTQENMLAFYRFPACFMHGDRNDVFSREGVEQSAQALNHVFGQTLFSVQNLPGYGHLDPLVGKHAARDVFGKIVAFLQHAPAFPAHAGMLPATPIGGATVRRRAASCGPLLGSLQADGAAGLRCRLWLRAAPEIARIDCVESVQCDANGKPLHASYAQHQVLQEPGFLLALPELTLDPACAGIRLAVRYHSQAQFSSLAQAACIPGMPQADSLAQQLCDLRSHSLAQEPQLETQAYAFCAWLEQDPDAANLVQIRPSARRAALAGPAAQALQFALGSCRYSSNAMDQQRADRPFAELLQGMRLGWADPAACLMLGDQIYVDASAGVLDEDARLEIFWERYQDAFNSPHARSFMAQTPVYQMLDDHEIQNDWEPMPQTPNEHLRMWNEMGQACFVGWQWAHSPRNGWPPAPGEQWARHYWYNFALAGLPFFMLDTRLEREARHACLKEETPSSRIISDVQMQALCDWLLAQQRRAPDAPKFIASPSILAPLAHDEAGDYLSRSDGWQAYPASLAQLGRFLLEHEIGHVVFLCGDLHAHFVCQLAFSDGVRSILAHSVVASPCFAPYHFINAKVSDMQAHSQRRLPDGLEFSSEILWSEQDYQGFLLLNVAPEQNGWRIGVQTGNSAHIACSFIA
ncbi:alpha/beta fold hydrolase [Massilia sp. W12]|uniref:alpha/beta fold hydrolase n=1 Tax=Massilia sp. W12 TaxID=3126507 RepID=UPI0030CBC7C6